MNIFLQSCYETLLAAPTFLSRSLNCIVCNLMALRFHTHLFDNATSFEVNDPMYSLQNIYACNVITGK